MNPDWFEKIAAIRDIKVMVIIASLIFAFLVILLGLLKDVLIITPLLFYIPIIVAAYWFPRRAVIFAIIIGAANIIVVYFSATRVCLTLPIRQRLPVSMSLWPLP